MRRSIVSLVLSLVSIGLSLLFIGDLLAQQDTVLAKIGEQVITQRDLNNYMERNIQMRRRQPPNAGKKEMLDNLIKEVLIASEAEKEKLDETPEFKSKLLEYRTDLLIQKYVSTKIQPFVKVSDEEINQKMKENPNLIPKPAPQLKGKRMNAMMKEQIRKAELYKKSQEMLDKKVEELKKAYNVEVYADRIQ